MNRPPNTYTPGTVLAPVLHAIGRPVTYYTTAGQVRAGIITRYTTKDGTYDVHVISGGTHTGARLGDLNNPQPNTFTYAP
jgi:hypothetical protein